MINTLTEQQRDTITILLRLSYRVLVLENDPSHIYIASLFECANGRDRGQHRVIAKRIKIDDNRLQSEDRIIQFLEGEKEIGFELHKDIKYIWFTEARF